MAYSTSNPPQCLVALPYFRLWVYKSADSQADVRVSGYFTNGYDLGIRAGDLLINIDTDTFATSFLPCNAATASAVDFADGTAITATDTD